MPITDDMTLDTEKAEGDEVELAASCKKRTGNMAERREIEMIECIYDGVEENSDCGICRG